MAINCSDPVTVNEGNDLTCLCRSKGGNPPTNLTWYDKDRNQIGKTSYGENELTLTNVNKQRSGRYKCKGQSYILRDEKSFEVKVRLNRKSDDCSVKYDLTDYVECDCYVRDYCMHITLNTNISSI